MINQQERNKYLIAALGGFFLFFLGPTVYAFCLMFKEGSLDILNDKYALSILQYLSYVPFTVFAIYILKDDLINDFRDFKKNLGKIIIGVVIGFIVMYICNIIVSVVYELFNLTGESANEELINSILLSDAALPMIISVVLLAPIAEELLFRKILFGVCEKTFRFKPVFSIIISTLIFSFIHVTDIESLVYIFQYIPLAFVMCVLYSYFKNNIYASILLHMANNTFAVLATYLYFYLGA